LTSREERRQAPPADAHALLSELAWARRLALHLTRDEAQADDLAQEAFVVAHQKPPRPDQPLRPWLGRVVKNLFRMQLRGEGRRHRREQVDADLLSSETAATTEEILHRVEAQRRLVELVQTLEEPLRTTLLLHYYEGLSSAEIARRLQIPAGTVRWRLKTGLDRLRSRLDDSYGKRALWLAALAPPLKGIPRMNPMTPFLKTGLLVTLGVAAVAAVAVTTHRAAPPSPTQLAAPVAAPALQGAAPTAASAAEAKATPAKTTRPTCTGVSCKPDEGSIIVTSVAGPVTLADKATGALETCFAGAESRGRIDFDLTLTGSGAARTVGEVAAVAGDRESIALQHPAVELCAVDALRGAALEVDAQVGAQLRISVLTNGKVTAEGDQPATPTRLVDARGVLDGLPSLGPSDAPVTLVEYSDFQCVFCAQGAKAAETLAQRYPTQLRVVFRNSPLPFDVNAIPAARAALAAHQQGKFWPMHDLLFANQQRLDHDSLFEYARSLGLDMVRFQAAFDSAATTQALANDADAAARLVVKATPIMTVNGKPIVGARPLSELAATIDAELAR
jgi:RNA polymerase sigma factor (sigma-70 family)